MIQQPAAKKLDPYEELGVAKDADEAEVRRAYKRRAKKVHPDKGGTAEEFNRASRALSVLVDPIRRKRFDDTGDAEDKPDDKEGKAFAMVAALVTRMLEDETVDILKFDLVASVRDNIQGEINNLATHVAKATRSMNRAKKVVGRFKKKKPGVNRIEAVVVRHLKFLEAKVVDLNEEIDLRKRAIEIVTDYSFDVEKANVADPFMIMRNATISWSR